MTPAAASCRMLLLALALPSGPAVAQERPLAETPAELAEPRAQATPTVSDQAEADAEASPWLDAWLFSAEGYRVRLAHDQTRSDHDARLLVDGGARAFDGAVGLDVSGALFWDIDGESPGLPSVHDARGPLNLYVDTLALSAQRTPWLQRASVGRLTVVEGWPMTLDGAAIAAVPVMNETLALVLFASGGRTVHFFDVDPDAFEDWAASLGADILTPDGVKLEVDYRALVEDSAGRRLQHSYGAAFFRRIDDDVLLHLYGRGIDSALSHVGGRAHLAWTPWRVGVDLEAAEQVATLGEVFEGQDPYFAILGPSAPHVRGSVDAFGRLDVGVLDGGLHLGAQGKRVLEGKTGPFNRDSARLYGAVDVADVAARALTPGLYASAILSYDFAVAPEQDSVAALGGGVGYRGELLRCSVGTSWDRTKYTYYRDVNEQVDVRTVSASAELRPWRALRVRADYTLELSATVMHTAQVTLAHDVGGTW